MSSTSGQSAEAVVLQLLMPNLEAEGFPLFVHPSRLLLPPFMQGYQPDAIAMRCDRKIAIEVKGRSGQSEPHIAKLREIFAAHPDWELRIIYAPAERGDEAIAVILHDRVVENLDRLLTIFDEAGPIPALFMGWSVFEAAARASVPDDLGRPQTPGRLLEMLASEAYILPVEADALRRLGKLRDAAAHGNLDITVTREEIAELVTMTHGLLDLPQSGS